jgi:hypothetical protein
MNRLARLLATLAILAAPALAGDCGSRSECSNCCPLAQQAVARYSAGGEAYRVSRTLQNDLYRAVVANLKAV